MYFSHYYFVLFCHITIILIKYSISSILDKEIIVLKDLENENPFNSLKSDVKHKGKKDFYVMRLSSLVVLAKT